MAGGPCRGGRCSSPTVRACVKSRSPISLFPEGDKFNSRGHPPGCQQPFDQPCKGLHNPNEMQPLQGCPTIRSLPGAVPPAIEFVPFGDEIGRRLRV